MGENNYEFGKSLGIYQDFPHHYIITRYGKIVVGIFIDFAIFV